MKKTNTGRNQTYARTLNNEFVIQALRQDDLSATELSEKLFLSNAAMSSILKGLLSQGIIKICASKSITGKGRKQVVYSLNESYGLIIVVSLSDNRYAITVSNIKEEILLEKVKEIDRYDVGIIYEIVLNIKDMLLDTRYRDIKLRNIIISVPGRVNSKTGELQLSKQFDKDLFEEKNNIQEIFQSHFNVPIYQYNDTNLSIIGEIKHGELVDSQNSLVAYIDNGIGGSFILNGDIYTGKDGYAGEIGLMDTYFHGKEDVLDEFVSLRSIKEYASQKYSKTFHVKDLVAEYQKKGELYTYINETAHLLGHKLKDIIELLNISDIVISGRVSQFGDDYLHCIEEEIKKSSNDCNVKFTKIGKKSVLFGAISTSVDCSIISMTRSTEDESKYY